MDEKIKQTQYAVKLARRYLKKGEVPITQKSLDEAVGLIQDKDKYIAELKEHEKELIAEQHKLFDLAKEQENEIKEYKNLEEKLGIDLITLFEALTQRIYIRDEFGCIKPILIEHFVPSMKGQELHTRGPTSIMHDKKGNLSGLMSTPFTYGEYHFGLKDYGKTWALTKEELEK